MQTDWELIRKVLNAAINACEAYERLNFDEGDRALTTGADGVTINDVMISAWAYPENLQYAVIRARHDLAASTPYRSDIARVLRETGNLCAELVAARTPSDENAARSHKAVRELVEPLCKWYEDTMTPRLAAASQSKKGP